MEGVAEAELQMVKKIFIEHGYTSRLRTKARKTEKETCRRMVEERNPVGISLSFVIRSQRSQEDR